MENRCESRAGLTAAEEQTLKEELDRLFSENEFSDILCDGRCATCMQREWCVLTPAARYVK